MENKNFLLFIEPLLPPSKKPLIDKAVYKMTGAIRESRKSRREIGTVLVDEKDAFQWFSGFSFTRSISCVKCCDLGLGVTIRAHDFEVIGGYYTNPLCLHFLAYHRDEIPFQQIQIIKQLRSRLVKPTVYDFLGNTSRIPART